MFLLQVFLSVKTYLQYKTIAVEVQHTIKDIPFPYIMICQKRKVENYQGFKYGFDRKNNEFHDLNKNSIESLLKTNFDLDNTTLKYDTFPPDSTFKYEV